MRTSALLASVAVATVTTTVMADDASKLCNSMTTCLRNGNAECNPATGSCPPCIYELTDKYTCWEKSDDSDECPFKDTLADCSETWGYDTSQTTPLSSTMEENAMESKGDKNEPTGTGVVDATADPTGSGSANSSGGDEAVLLGLNMTMLVVIGVSIAVVLIILIACVCLCRRRRRRAVSKEQHDVAGFTPARAKGVPYENDAGYKNHLDSSKYQQKNPQHVAPDMGGMPHGKQSPVMLYHEQGDKAAAYMNGGSPSRNSRSGSSTVPSSTNDVARDVSIRCTQNTNVFDEYLRMKKEMNYDRESVGATSDLSDLEGGSVSMHKFSLDSTATANRHDFGYSITDSEYAEAMSIRGESECYSELSINDEKYSFAESETARKTEREVEI